VFIGSAPADHGQAGDNIVARDRDLLAQVFAGRFGEGTLFFFQRFLDGGMLHDSTGGFVWVGVSSSPRRFYRIAGPFRNESQLLWVQQSCTSFT